MAWKLDSNKPIYQQIITTLKKRIISGHYALGEKLPSVRALAMEAAVNPNTMQRAMLELSKDGIITTNRTSGYYVTEDASIIQNMKINASEEILNTFFKNMLEIGFPVTEIIQQVSNYSTRYNV